MTEHRHTAPAGDGRTILQQHAYTLHLLGVDTMPRYARGPVPKAEGARVSVEDASEPRTIPSVVDHAAGGSVELKPAVPDQRRAEAQRRLDAVLERYLQDQPHRHFVTAHSKIVFGDGDPCARLMFIGEAPGADEDRIGKPFVGRAGQLLNKMIAAMRLRREDVYITNVLKTRPPNNATPTIEEAQACAPYLYDQILAVEPEVIVTLGLPATRLLLQTDQTMSSLRGRWATWRHPDQLRYPGVEVAVMPTFHPAFLLRSYTPENRAKVWSDLKQVMVRLGLSPASTDPPDSG
jgi:uracil-DNA glycosylase family 4